MQRGKTVSPEKQRDFPYTTQLLSKCGSSDSELYRLTNLQRRVVEASWERGLNNRVDCVFVFM